MTLLIANQFVLHFFLVTVASLQQFLGLLIGNVRQLFGSLLFEDETLDPVLERRLLVLTISLKIARLQHIKAFFKSLATTQRTTILHN